MSTRGDYASRALLSLALGADLSTPTSVRDLATRTGLPQPYLEQILLSLKGVGLVRSKRGVGGGLRARTIRPNRSPSPRSSPPWTVRSSRATSANPTRTAPATTRASACCSGVWADVGNHMREHLSSFTLADMVMQARGGRPVKRTHSA